MEDETARKRLEKKLRREAMREVNGHHKRLEWVRRKLGLMLSQVAEATGIASSTLADWEYGRRTLLWEELGLLEKYYSELWADKFTTCSPRYDGKEVGSITLKFIMLGNDPTMEEIREMNEELQKRLRQVEQNLALEHEARKQVQEELRAQIEMFEGEG